MLKKRRRRLRFWLAGKGRVCIASVPVDGEDFKGWRAFGAWYGMVALGVRYAAQLGVNEKPLKIAGKVTEPNPYGETHVSGGNEVIDQDAQAAGDGLKAIGRKRL